MGGDLECYYFMFGQYDGAVILSAPDSTSAAAVAVAVASSGALSHLETHELISTEDAVGILQKAKELTYRPPGA